MSEHKLFKNDIGVKIRVYLGVDVSDTSSITFKVEKPSGVVASWVATLDSTNTFYADYYTISGDLNEEGVYSISAVIVTNDSKTITGQADSFRVYKQFDDL